MLFSFLIESSHDILAYCLLFPYLRAGCMLNDCNNCFSVVEHSSLCLRYLDTFQKGWQQCYKLCVLPSAKGFCALLTFLSSVSHFEGEFVFIGMSYRSQTKVCSFACMLYIRSNIQEKEYHFEKNSNLNFIFFNCYPASSLQLVASQLYCSIFQRLISTTFYSFLVQSSVFDYKNCSRSWCFWLINCNLEFFPDF